MGTSDGKWERGMKMREKVDAFSATLLHTNNVQCGKIDLSRASLSLFFLAVPLYPYINMFYFDTQLSLMLTIFLHPCSRMIQFFSLFFLSIFGLCHPHLVEQFCLMSPNDIVHSSWHHCLYPISCWLLAVKQLSNSHRLSYELALI